MIVCCTQCNWNLKFSLISVLLIKVSLCLSNLVFNAIHIHQVQKWTCCNFSRNFACEHIEAFEGQSFEIKFSWKSWKASKSFGNFKKILKKAWKFSLNFCWLIFIKAFSENSKKIFQSFFYYRSSDFFLSF